MPTPPPLELWAGRALPDDLRARLESTVLGVPVDLGGGSGVVKALILADLVVGEGVERVVEIGVWRGRSLLPMAATLDHLGRGEAVGIDPYRADAALQTDEHGYGDALTRWAEDTDWDAVHAEVLGRIEALGLGRRCRLLRMTSEVAAERFPDASIDLLHVDGNHDRRAVERDLALYGPALRDGGLLVLDDISWSSVRDAAATVRDSWERVVELADPEARVFPESSDFGVYRRPARSVVRPGGAA